MNLMDGVVIHPCGAEIYLDDAGEPCLRLVEALGQIVDGKRVRGAGWFIEHWDGERWQYVEGPFHNTLCGVSEEALAALQAAAAITMETGDGRR